MSTRVHFFGTLYLGKKTDQCKCPVEEKIDIRAHTLQVHEPPRLMVSQFYQITQSNSFFACSS
jgi:hypothetical protein